MALVSVQLHPNLYEMMECSRYYLNIPKDYESSFSLDQLDEDDINTFEAMLSNLSDTEYNNFVFSDDSEYEEGSLYNLLYEVVWNWAEKIKQKREIV